ncbi:SseB family protein [Agrococcus terreus]|uniref:SseB protein N-terminal domain-containing protein n=1 Tax=Agrococcus terreus TaxID=574649 RepID=A0ABQ2KQN7_9MICO|nr:SseB family protein [Agrococcus terreus]GGN87169.1 hypothetical protein GCM10010968_21410 [Agrococcus terreus]
MTNPTLDALGAIGATDHDAAWAVVREAELVLPAVVDDPKDPASGNFLTIPNGKQQFIVAFTALDRVGGFVTRTKAHLRLTGAELAAAAPEGYGIVLDPGHKDGRVFLPEVYKA